MRMTRERSGEPPLLKDCFQIDQYASELINSFHQHLNVFFSKRLCDITLMPVFFMLALLSLLSVFSLTEKNDGLKLKTCIQYTQ